MPRFFFHVLNDVAVTQDEDGQELSDLEAACSEARRAIGEIIGQDVAGGRNSVHLTIKIDDAAGNRVANIKAVTRVISSLNPLSS